VSPLSHRSGCSQTSSGILDARWLYQGGTGEAVVIRLIFQCDGAAGRERLQECLASEVFKPEGYGSAIYPGLVAAMQIRGWTFRHFGARFIVRCPKCETLRVQRNEARAKRDRLREARKR
jgi:hypothetical protein